MLPMIVKDEAIPLVFKVIKKVSLPSLPSQSPREHLLNQNFVEILRFLIPRMDLLSSILRRKKKRLFCVCHDHKNKKLSENLHETRTSKKVVLREDREHNSLSALNTKTLLILNLLHFSSL